MMTHVQATYQPIFRELGLDAEMMFEHPLIKPWRRLSDRENCTLDATLNDGRRIRWHLKRYPTPAAKDELAGQRLLVEGQIPTVEVVGWGTLPDRRSFIIFEDLAGYVAGDKLIESGVPFERVLNATAEVAAKLHRAGLHHRDLYLCHFFIRLGPGGPDVRLIDTARVRRLPGLFTRTRWIVKDLAQFWYSTMSLPITDEQRVAWLDRYAREGSAASPASLRRRIVRKAAWIARHDQRLRRHQPTRNVSIPPSPLPPDEENSHSPPQNR